MIAPGVVGIELLSLPAKSHHPLEFGGCCFLLMT